MGVETPCHRHPRIHVAQAANAARRITTNARLPAKATPRCPSAWRSGRLPALGHRTCRNYLVVRSRIRIGQADSRLNSGGRVAPARVRPRQHANGTRLRGRLRVHRASVGAGTGAGHERLHAGAVHGSPQRHRSAEGSPRDAGAEAGVNPKAQIPNPKSQGSNPQQLRFLLGFGFWDLGFGIFQRSQSLI